MTSPLYVAKPSYVLPSGGILWVISDAENRTQWVDRLDQSTVLEPRGPFDFVLYEPFGLPAVVADRDFVYRLQISRPRGQDATKPADELPVHISVRSVVHSKAPETVGVRGELMWTDLEFGSALFARIPGHDEGPQRRIVTAGIANELMAITVVRQVEVCQYDFDAFDVS